MDDIIGFSVKKFEVGVCERPRMFLRPFNAVVAFNEMQHYSRPLVVA
jgi:hypothetical protein